MSEKFDPSEAGELSPIVPPVEGEIDYMEARYWEAHARLTEELRERFFRELDLDYEA